MKKIFCSILFLLFSISLNAQIYPDKPLGYVYDGANIINDVKNLDKKILDYEKKTSIEIAVVTIPASQLADEEIFDYCQNLWQKWKIGKKETNTGLLLLITNDSDKKKRKWRIHTGYGMESIITDAEAKSIGTNILVPYFQKGKYNEGIFATVDALMNKMTFASPEERQNFIDAKKKEQELKNIKSKDQLITIVIILGIIFFVGGIGYLIFFFIKKAKKTKHLKNVFQQQKEKAYQKLQEIKTNSDFIDLIQRDIASEKEINNLTENIDSISFSSEEDVDKIINLNIKISEFIEKLKQKIKLISFVRNDIDVYCFNEKQKFTENAKKAKIFIEKINNNYPSNSWNNFDYSNFSLKIKNDLLNCDRLLTSCQNLITENPTNFDLLQQNVDNLEKQYNFLKDYIATPEKLYYQLQNSEQNFKEEIKKIPQYEIELEKAVSSCSYDYIKNEYQSKLTNLKSRTEQLRRDSKGSSLNWIILYSSLSLIISEYIDVISDMNRDLKKQEDQDDNSNFAADVITGVAIGSLLSGIDTDSDIGGSDFGGGDSGGGGADGDW